MASSIPFERGLINRLANKVIQRISGILPDGCSGVTTVLTGGMGNQMFQYAAGLALAKRLNVGLKLEISSFDTDHMRRYSLGLWSGVTQPLVTTTSGSLIREKAKPYDPDIFPMAPRHCTLYGYWQTEKYFSHLRSALTYIFTPKQPLTSRGQESLWKIIAEGPRSVFLTIRRTDYTRSDRHWVLPHDYYLKASAIIAARVGDPHFFIFSDEPEWATRHFRLPYRTTVVGNFNMTTRDHLGREDEELWLMRHCKHAVMANSTYSWWGAWLNSDTDRVVIAPAKWYQTARKDVRDDVRDVVPETWLRVKSFS